MANCRYNLCAILYCTYMFILFMFVVSRSKIAVHAMILEMSVLPTSPYGFSILFIVYLIYVLIRKQVFGA